VGDPASGVGRAFLRLGMTSFGGPVAHLGFFRTEFVERRRWLGESQYADLVALAQFLPGPASSQVGMGVGLRRAGIGGSLRAWVGFTLPSAVLLIGAGLAVGSGVVVPSGIVAGLKVAAVAVVAQAVVQMARALCGGWLRALVALASAVAVLSVPTVWMPSLVLLISALLGVAVVRDLGGRSAASGSEGGVLAMPRWMPTAALTAFVVLLVGLPVLARVWPVEWLVLVAGFYRAGALVFGGGHVVLPMLEEVVVGSGAVAQADFVAGYGLANAVPGPLFTFAGYLGAVAGGPALGIVALIAIFLPGYLLVVGVLGHWHRLAGDVRVRRALAAVNAAVVGLLAAALYDPVWIAGITGWTELVLACAAFVALLTFRVAPHLVVLGCALLGWALLG
jgi:chromate transporter